MELARTHPARFGYLLKDRVLDVVGDDQSELFGPDGQPTMAKYRARRGGRDRWPVPPGALMRSVAIASRMLFATRHQLQVSRHASWS